MTMFPTGHPTPVQLHVKTVTNASINLGWAYPPPPTETIQSFLVTYSLYTKASHHL